MLTDCTTGVHQLTSNEWCVTPKAGYNRMHKFQWYFLSKYLYWGTHHFTMQLGKPCLLEGPSVVVWVDRLDRHAVLSPSHTRSNFWDDPCLCHDPTTITWFYVMITGRAQWNLRTVKDNNQMTGILSQCICSLLVMQALNNCNTAFIMVITFPSQLTSTL